MREKSYDSPHSNAVFEVPHSNPHNSTQRQCKLPSKDSTPPTMRAEKLSSFHTSVCSEYEELIETDNDNLHISNSICSDSSPNKFFLCRSNSNFTTNKCFSQKLGFSTCLHRERSWPGWRYARINSSSDAQTCAKWYYYLRNSTRLGRIEIPLTEITKAANLVLKPMKVGCPPYLGKFIQG